MTAPPVEGAGEGFVLIEGGVFLMGSPLGEPERAEEELQREVTIGHRFRLQVTEVTRAEWSALMDTQPWLTGCEGGACPVENVNWFEAAAYANALSEAEGLQPCYRLIGCNAERPGEGYECELVEAVGLGCAGYRLPTEAEWEYAARGGGLQQRYPWGDALATCDLAVMADGPQGQDGCGTNGPLPVCSRPAGHTVQGLCDMAGNVDEWTEDWYGPYADAPVDGTASEGTAEFRVLRGGGWFGTAPYLRVAVRDRGLPGDRDDYLGFRLARSVP